MNNEFELMEQQEVLDMLKIKRSSLYYWINNGTFPKPLKLGSRQARWVKKDIVEWFERKYRESKL